MGPSRDPNSPLYPVLRFVLSLLNFLEEEYQTSSNSTTFKNLVQYIRYIYPSCNYENDKSTIVITESLFINYANYLIRVKESSITIKEDITKKIMECFAENANCKGHGYPYKKILSTIEKLTGQVYNPEEECTKMHLSQIFYGSQAAIYNTLGRKYASKKRNVQALCSFTMAINFQPKVDVYYCNRAAVHLRLKNYHRVIADAAVAMTLNPFTRAHDYIGELCMDMGFYKDAVDIYTKLLKVQPNSVKYAIKKYRATKKMLGHTTSAKTIKISTANMQVSSL